MMATRITYTLLVDGRRRIECCQERRNRLDHLFPIVQMASSTVTVQPDEDLASCSLCGMPCLYHRNRSEL